MALLPSVQSVLHRFMEMDITAGELVDLLAADPRLLEAVIGQVDLPKQEEPDIEETNPLRTAGGLSPHRAVQLLGMSRARDAVAASELRRILTWVSADAMKDPGFRLDPERARLCEEVCRNNRIPYGDTAYVGGLFWDLILTLAKGSGKRIPDEFIRETWTHALRTAVITNHLADCIPRFTHRKHAFSAGLAHKAGKIVMAALHDDYMAQAATWVPLAREARFAAEKSTYPYTHDEVSALCLSLFGPLRTVETAVRFHTEPYFLNNVAPKHYPLACLLSLASSLARDWKPFKESQVSTDPVLILRVDRLGISAQQVSDSLADALDASLEAGG